MHDQAHNSATKISTEQASHNFDELIRQSVYEFHHANWESAAELSKAAIERSKSTDEKCVAQSNYAVSALFGNFSTQEVVKLLHETRAELEKALAIERFDFSDGSSSLLNGENAGQIETLGVVLLNLGAIEYSKGNLDQAEKLMSDGIEKINFVGRCCWITQDGIHGFFLGLQNKAEVLAKQAQGLPPDDAKTKISEVESLREHAERVRLTRGLWDNHWHANENNFTRPENRIVLPLVPYEWKYPLIM